MPGIALSDWELWACAKQQVEQYGKDAPEIAALRADALLEADDRNGHRTWMAILSRIRALQGAQQGETEH
jgi:hypothetical protein